MDPALIVTTSPIEAPGRWLYKFDNHVSVSWGHDGFEGGVMCAEATGNELIGYAGRTGCTGITGPIQRVVYRRVGCGLPIDRW